MAIIRKNSEIPLTKLFRLFLFCVSGFIFIIFGVYFSDVTAGAATTAWTDATITATPVKATHMQEMRNAINAKRASIGLAPFSLTSTTAKTLPVMVASQTGSQGIAWWSMAALSTAAIAPLILIGVFLEKYIVKGLTAGAVK